MASPLGDLIYILVFLYKKIRFHYFFMSKEKLEKLRLFYSTNFSYYNLLNQKEKRKFLVRTINIREQNQLNISTKVKNADSEVELLICAAMAQITFGYSDYELEKFNKIVIHPNTFFSRYINHQVKGLTVGSGFIHYSWEDFVSGYKNENDKINLALHELAHALYLERFIESEEFDWRLWKTKAVSVMESERNNKHSLFRQYGTTNINEFWAVTVECFFEDPIVFKEQHTELYNATAFVLKQDMALRKAVFRTAQM
jgi:Mlc titration factor MtfA (ptsG expression regulator)